MEGWRKEYISHPPEDPRDYDPSEPDFGGTFESSEFQKFLQWLEEAAEEGLDKEEVEKILSTLKKGINKRGIIIAERETFLRYEETKLEEDRKQLSSIKGELKKILND